MRKHFFQEMKKIFRDWDVKVMSFVMLVVTATCVITATVAWFTMSINASVRNMMIKTADGQVIKVAVEASGEDVDILRENGENPLITISPESIAPGAAGEITLYVTPMKSDVKSCKIVPSFYEREGEEDIFEEGIVFTDAINNISDETEKTEEIALLRQLVKGHILIYENRVEGQEQTLQYTGQITEEQPLEVTLTWNEDENKGVEEKITIYWYWPYEYDEVPEETKGKIATTEVAGEGLLSRDLFFDPIRDKEDNYSEKTYTRSRLYDYADTRICSNVESLRFHFEVSAGYGQNKN